MADLGLILYPDLTALISIGPELHDEAEIDRASRWRKAVHMISRGIPPSNRDYSMLSILGIDHVEDSPYEQSDPFDALELGRNTRMPDWYSDRQFRPNRGRGLNPFGHIVHVFSWSQLTANSHNGAQSLLAGKGETDALSKEFGGSGLDGCIALLMVSMVVVMINPIFYVRALSVSLPFPVRLVHVSILPPGLTVLGDRGRQFWTAYKNSLLYVVVGPPVNLVLTAVIACSQAIRELIFGNQRIILVAVPLFFSGVLLPAHRVMQSLGLISGIWPPVSIGMVSTFDITVYPTVFQLIPVELTPSPPCCPTWRRVTCLIFIPYQEIFSSRTGRSLLNIYCGGESVRCS